MKNDTSEMLFRFAQICGLLAICFNLIAINQSIKAQNEIQKEFTTEILNQIKK